MSTADDTGGGMRRGVMNVLSIKPDTRAAQFVNVSFSLGKQVATLFLGALAVAVAMQWNQTVQSAIALWTPTHQENSKAKALEYNLYATFVLTMMAVLIAALLVRIYGKSVSGAQAGYYGLAV